MEVISKYHFKNMQRMWQIEKVHGGGMNKCKILQKKKNK